ncbi:DUF4391 domain-containing protein [Devosia sp. 1566]|uniref:DUF4391 domain-containing protein n=1 Tax=Devosia sp. 1566 TaxID=2499144 RepID=UPI000FD706AC|nr:DUF4391 domain-containing protein [Devosia sp. 1566]
MTADGVIGTIVEALALPASARVDARVPKKMLVEQGAPTAADKRAIQDGIDELQWFAACKPATIGVPSFADETRDYLEIAIIGCAFRPAAKSTRLIELIHRAVPYPVLLITANANGAVISVAHKRKAQNEVDRVVIDHVVATTDQRLDPADVVQRAFLQSLALPQQNRADLHALYSGWLARIEALNAAQVSGAFVATNDSTAISRRRAALDDHSRLTKEIEALRAKAKREKQLNRLVDLNLAIQRVEAELANIMQSI